MKISHNELHNICKKVFEACGYPYGADDEAATMVGMLEVVGLGGIARLHGCLKKIETKGFPNTIKYDVNNGGMRVDSNGYSTLALASSIVDLAYLESKHKRDYAVTIENGEDAIFITPILLKIRDTQFSAKLIWYENDEYYCFMRPENAAESIMLQSKRDLIPSTDFQLVFNPNDKPNTSSFEATRTYTQMKDSENQAIEYGIEVDTLVWQELQQFAKRVFVPESAQSRAKGAG